jgi:hypothetical protein
MLVAAPNFGFKHVRGESVLGRAIAPLGSIVKCEKLRIHQSNNHSTASTR